MNRKTILATAARGTITSMPNRPAKLAPTSRASITTTGWSWTVRPITLGEIRWLSICWTTSRTRAAQTALRGWPEMRAMITASPPPMNGPISGTRLNTPATIPTSSQNGSPMAHRPIEEATPTNRATSSWPRKKPPTAWPIRSIRPRISSRQVDQEVEGHDRADDEDDQAAQQRGRDRPEPGQVAGHGLAVVLGRQPQPDLVGVQAEVGLLAEAGRHPAHAGLGVVQVVGEVLDHLGDLAGHDRDQQRDDQGHDAQEQQVDDAGPGGPGHPPPLEGGHDRVEQVDHGHGDQQGRDDRVDIDDQPQHQVAEDDDPDAAPGDDADAHEPLVGRRAVRRGLEQGRPRGLLARLGHTSPPSGSGRPPRSGMPR